MARARRPKPIYPAGDSPQPGPVDPEPSKVTESCEVDLISEETGSRWVTTAVVCLLALLCGSLNAINGYNLFENDRYFSHLSTLEREMTFRTEMGLYYSYYKSLVHAPTIAGGLRGFLENNLTEFPSTINVLKRFNLYPEVVVGLAFRIFNQTASMLHIETTTCWTVSRKDMPSVESCSGIGDPANFYILSVYVWNAVTGLGLVGLSYLVSESGLGALLSSIVYFCNFSEATRIQWTPPLRESFAYPFLLLQMFQTTRLLNRHIDGLSCAVYVISTTFALLFWQFSQFALLTEICALFAVFSVHNGLHWRQMQYLSVMHLLALFIAYNLLFMNDMLLTSLYTSVVMSAVITTKVRVLNMAKNTLAKTVLQLGFFVVLAVAIKIFLGFILQVTDDSHIWNILRAKLSNYRDFHSMLYMCAPEFDFLKVDYLKSLWPTMLVPLGVASCLGAVHLFRQRQSLTSAMLYNLYQCAAFLIMALLIMRLKMFLTPHLAVLASLAVSRRFIRTLWLRMAIMALLLAIIAVPGWQRFQEEHSHQGEYSNPKLEELLNFIDTNTNSTDSFAGPMPLMANVLLSTGRPIVNHPHYEDAEIRAKTVGIYTLLSRKSLREAHSHLKRLKARYIVLSRSWCFGKMRTGCALVDIWDELDPSNRSDLQVCDRLLRRETQKFFNPVFHNGEYMMLGVA